MRDVVCRLVVPAAVVCLAAPAFAQQVDLGEKPGRNHFTVVAADSPIEVDGALLEAAWQSATVVPLTHEWAPSDNAAPPVATECLVTFDDENLYVAFRASDPDPAQIRAFLADRDTAFLDDTVGFLLDTFNDRRRAFSFRVNPLGVQMEALVNDLDPTSSGDVREDWSWDAIWDSAGRLTEGGYEVEIAIPFRQLRFPSGGQPQTWGFLATRSYPRSVVHQLASTRNERSLDCLVCQLDSIAGLQRIESGHNLEVVPTVTASRTDARPALSQPLQSGDEDAEAGISVRWGITPSVSLNLTANPDFSNVEADVAQLDVNERFALNFPEKRPFFLEGSDFYSTHLPVVFTRTVTDPKFGLKLTGKQGPSAFGIIAAQDQFNNLLIPGPERSRTESIDEDLSSAVLRYRRDVGKFSTLGLVYTGREGEDDYSNHVYGVDGTFHFTASDTIRVQALGSTTRYDDAVAQRTRQPLGTFDDRTLAFEYVHGTKNWFWGGNYEDRGDEFRADSGFLPQVGTTYAGGAVRRIFWGQPGGWYSRFVAEVNGSRNKDHGGLVLDEDINLFLTYEGPRQSVVRLRLLPRNHESFLGRAYSHQRADFLVSTRPRGGFFYELFLRGGEDIDVTNNRSIDLFSQRHRVEWKLGRRLSGNLQYTHQAFEFEGDRYLTADLAQTRLIYNFNVHTFVRLILQYQDVTRVPSLFNNPASVRAKQETFFTQFLFSYKLNPQTVLLAGYSDNHEGTVQGPVELDLRQRDRTFFLKLGYALLQ